MARPNRNNRDLLDIVVPETAEESLYHAAIYARLSVEDNGCGSDSIANQMELLNKYVSNHRELELTAAFYDNGMTGTNFDRPGFIAMLEEVKSGKINCIVVKDLSRFGRNYMETGNYLEKIFPYLGVRFISVNDNYDSISVTANEALALSLKNVYHHIYAKDISRKICTLFDEKKKQGMFLGRFAPYGYKKSQANRYQLEIEEETADVIRDIFRMRIEGLGVAAIARILNDKGVPSFYKMLFEREKLKGTNGEADALWSGGSVKGILENPVYCGCIVERKSDHSYYKGGQKRALPKSEWNYIENTHEAIIGKDTFETVQRLMEESRQFVKNKLEQSMPRERTENVLRGLLVCGYCKKKMVRGGGYYDAQGKLIRHRFYCPVKYRGDGGCKMVSITESEMLSKLLVLVKTQLELLADTKALTEDILKSYSYASYKNEQADRRKTLESQIAQLKIKSRELYQDYKKGLLPESAYAFAENKQGIERRSLEVALAALNNTNEATPKIVEPHSEKVTELLGYRKETVLSREMCLALVERVEVYNGQLAVHYKFRSEYDEMIAFLSECEKVGVMA